VQSTGPFYRIIYLYKATPVVFSNRNGDAAGGMLAGNGEIRPGRQYAAAGAGAVSITGT